MSKKATKLDITKQVMASVRSDKVQMHSRRYFMLLSVLTLLGLLAAVVVAIYFINFTVHGARSRGSLDYLSFGAGGIGEFVGSFPWLWLLLAAIGLVSVLYLLRRYEFVYKHHFYAIITGALIALVVVGSASAFVVRPPGRPLPPMHGIEGRVGGEITKVEGGNIEIKTPQGEQVEVNIDDAHLLRGQIVEGQRVLILGEWDGQEFKARAIRPAPARGRRPF